MSSRSPVTSTPSTPGLQRVASRIELAEAPGLVGLGDIQPERLDDQRSRRGVHGDQFVDRVGPGEVESGLTRFADEFSEPGDDHDLLLVDDDDSAEQEDYDQPDHDPLQHLEAEPQGVGQRLVGRIQGFLGHHQRVVVIVVVTATWIGVIVIVMML